MTGSISITAICVIVLVIAAMRIGAFWTLIIAICGTGVGAVAVLSGVAMQLVHAVTQAAAAFGGGG